MGKIKKWLAGVARGYKVSHDDNDASKRLGPCGFRPEELRAPGEPLVGWESSPSALFDWLRRQMKHDQLLGIAQADYGSDVGLNYQALKDICDSGLVPMQLEWIPHEVISLCRWDKGEGVDHAVRALCCTLLCLCDGAASGLDDTVPILVEGCLALGGKVSQLAELFLAWVGPSYTHTDHAIGLLGLFLIRAATAPEDPRLKTLATHIIERACSIEEPFEVIDSLPYVINYYSVRAELWRALITRILLPLRDKAEPFAQLHQLLTLVP